MSVKMSHMEIASAAPTGLPKGRLYIRIHPVSAPAFNQDGISGAPGGNFPPNR